MTILKTLGLAFFALHLHSIAVCAQDTTPSKSSALGYPNAPAALEALRRKPGVSISVQGGWTIATDRSAYAIWSFTPPEHPAHPSVVRRTVFEKSGSVQIRTDVLCKAAKPACDKLVADFNQLNSRMRDNITGRQR